MILVGYIFFFLILIKKRKMKKIVFILLIAFGGLLMISSTPLDLQASKMSVVDPDPSMCGSWFYACYDCKCRYVTKCGTWNIPCICEHCGSTQVGEYSWLMCNPALCHEEIPVPPEEN